MTEFVFRAQSYLKSLQATVINVGTDGSIELDRTIFYASSGGQPNDTGRHTVHLLDLGQIGSQVMSDDYATFEQARQAADQWNTANGITPQRAAEILAGPKGPLAAGPARIESVS